MSEGSSKAAGKAPRLSSAPEPSPKHLVPDDEPPAYGDQPDRPPPYSGSSNHSSRTPQIGNDSKGPIEQPIPSLPPIDVSRYEVPQSVVSRDRSTVTITLPWPGTDKESLLSLFLEQAALPPQPEFLFDAYWDVEHRREMCDAEFSMLGYLVSSDERKWKYSFDFQGQIKRAGIGGGFTPESSMSLASGKPTTLEGWVETFLNDPIVPRSFSLTRGVSNMDIDYIKRKIREEIESKRPQGHVRVRWIFKYSKVIFVLAPMASKNTIWKALSSTRRPAKVYDVVTTVWPYANKIVGDNRIPEPRICTVRSEEDWWENWKDLIDFTVSHNAKIRYPHMVAYGEKCQAAKARGEEVDIKEFFVANDRKWRRWT